MHREPYIHNVPMALDLETLRTQGLEPSLAMARNRAYMEDARQCTLGPMPVDTFIDTFLKESSADRSDFLSPKKAFNAVPQRADSAAEIYDPLVSTYICHG